MQVRREATEASAAREIVARIVAGDAQAESDMVGRYQRGLIAMLYNRSKDKVLAEDVAQDTWVLVIQKVREQELRDTSKLASFITQIGKNQLIMKYRSINRYDHVSGDEIGEVVDQRGQTPEQGLINSQLGHAIGTLLDDLKQPRDRELIKRFYLSGDGKGELCKEYGLTEAHFDRVLFRARERFKKLWAERSGVKT